MLEPEYRSMKKILFPLLFVGLLGGAVAVCDSDPNGLADGDPYIIGLIEDVRDGGSNCQMLWIES